MLAAMQKLGSPKDEHFFTFAFLQRLPREIRVLLAQDDQSEKRARQGHQLLRFKG
jgi:hypothetical protein